MKPDEREELIERYLSGSMTPMEQHEFRIRLALDDELSRRVRACGMVDGMIEADRRDLITDDSALRSRVLSMSMAGREAQVVGEAAATGRSAFTLFKAMLLSVAVIGSAVSLLLLNGDREPENPTGHTRAVSGAKIDTAPAVSIPLPSQARNGVTEQTTATPSSIPSQRKTTVTDREERRSSVSETMSAPSTALPAAPAATPPEEAGTASSDRSRVPSPRAATDTLSRSLNMKGTFQAPKRVK